MRAGFALATTFWAVVTASGALLVAFMLTHQQLRWEVKIQEASDHFYLGEGVLAQEVNRLKARSWYQRWYANPAAGGKHSNTTAVLGAAISGQFPRLTGNPGEIVAEYEGWVQDVGDFWTSERERAMVLHTDIFLKVTYPVTYPKTSDQPPAEVRHYFYRVVFRPPSLERPNTVNVRRFAGVPAFEPLNRESRGELLCRMEADELEREKNRPEARVFQREILALVRGGVPLGQIARSLVRPPPSASGLLPAAVACTAEEELARERERARGDATARAARQEHRADGSLSMAEISRLLRADGSLERQVQLETRYLAELTEGQRAMVNQAPLQEARDAFDRALSIARGQDVANGSYTVPQALYALGSAEWSYARTLRRSGREAVERRTILDAARSRWSEIVRAYPWRDPGFADRMEAPHAHVPLALSRVDRADPADAAEMALAVAEARRTLDELRTSYPHFHLWDEDAITGRRHPGQANPTDEIVWFLQKLLPRGLVALGGMSSNKPSPVIQRWLPDPVPVGNWVEVGRLVAPRTSPCGLLVRPVRGRVMGDQVLILGGAFRGPSAEYYDIATNRSRAVRQQVAQEGTERTALMIDDRTALFFGGIEPTWTGTRWAGTEFALNAHLFDTVTETFRQAAPMIALGGKASAVLVPDGRVLGVGGDRNNWPNATAELYDPRTDRWSRAPNPPAGWRDRPNLTALDDGSVLLTGGSSADAGTETLTSPGTAHLYFPDKNRFWPGNPPATAEDVAPWPATPMGEMTHFRNMASAVKLEDGRVLVANGMCERGPVPAAPAFNDSEIYDPVKRTFTAGTRTVDTAYSRGTCRLTDGRVVLNGGRASSRAWTAYTSEIYDPARGAFVQAASLAIPFSDHLTFELGGVAP